METIAKFFGFLALGSFGATVMNFITKYIKKNFYQYIKKYKIVDKYFPILVTIFVKYHKIWGLMAVGGLLLHFSIMWTINGISITGIIAGCILGLQVLLGIYGSKQKKKRSGAWFILHRIISLLLIVTILGHLLFKA
ncbi:hypothetical protein [Peptostreptococcus equinus]|uniref:Cytochrome b561 domain-containing protein n=1 Tax=Peptostreptococcus equinus TaxID=3003601 RepID=A0ABY7JTL3_9FIRM|nr:hypothetical protein [Peptostreptococcus sp. CBA3647]WAW15408.1 hypothetical protein O0R46_02890 [Peptostreptococcus sp. CBA3647]